MCGSAAGLKLPPLIVFAGVEDGPVHCKLQMNDAHRGDEAILTVQPKAYCNERVMLEWIESVRYFALILIYI